MSLQPNRSSQTERFSRKHRCRRSCPTQVERHKAFCFDCWRKVPNKVRRRVMASWSRVLDNGDLDTYGKHVELLLTVEEALEGDREWESLT